MAITTCSEHGDDVVVVYEEGGYANRRGCPACKEKQDLEARRDSFQAERDDFEEKLGNANDRIEELQLEVGELKDTE